MAKRNTRREERRPSPARRALWLGALATTLLATACDESTDVTLRFERANADPTEHVFPDDLYVGPNGLLSQFSEAQYAALPFSKRLRDTSQMGWAPIGAVRVPFTSVGEDVERWLDLDTLEGAFALYRTDVSPAAAVEIGELTYQPATNSVLVRPRVPFASGTYALVVRDGLLETRGGGAVKASPDQRLVQRDGDPATDDAFAAVAAVDPLIATRDDTLAFVALTVVDQTTSMTLLRSYVDGKLAVDDDGDDELLDVTPWAPADAREIAVEGGQVAAQGEAAVGAFYAAAGLGGLDTRFIDRIVAGQIATPNFVSDPVFQVLEVPDNQTFKGRTRAVPFGTDNPLSLSASAPSRALPYLMVLPATPAATPTPVVVAMHGVGRSKEDWLAMAPALAQAGFAVIAIDLYQHGARQASIPVPEGDFSAKVDVVLAAQGIDFPDPFVNPTFLTRTRDKLRQSVVDHLALIRLLSEADGASALIDLDGDGAPDDWGPVSVLGQSLGAMLGTVVAAVSPEVERAALSVPGGPLPDIVSTSPTLAPTLDLLLYGTANTPTFGLLAGSERRLLPDTDEREIFGRVAEVLLAPVDPLTFAPHVLAGTLGNGSPRVLVQLATQDEVVPARAGARLARAMTVGVPAEAFPLVAPERFAIGLPVAEGLGARGGVTQVDGGHGVLLDFASPAATAIAQQQVVNFLAAP